LSTGEPPFVLPHPRSKLILNYTDEPQEPGEEVLATYGAHSNDKLLVHYGFVCATNPDMPNQDDDIRLDQILLPSSSDSVRSQLQDVGFLGGYALLPATNELCFKTQVAVRAMLLSSNEWEYFVANGEDLAEDHTADVQNYVARLLREYRDDVCDMIAKVRICDAPGEVNEIALLETRWRQILEAVDAYLLTCQKR